MAKVTAKEITKMVEVKEPGVILELTKEEAIVVRALVGNVGGSPDGLLQHSQSVYNALVKAGYAYHDSSAVRSAVDSLSGTLRFN